MAPRAPSRQTGGREKVWSSSHCVAVTHKNLCARQILARICLMVSLRHTKQYGSWLGVISQKDGILEKRTNLCRSRTISVTVRLGPEGKGAGVKAGFRCLLLEPRIHLPDNMDPTGVPPPPPVCLEQKWLLPGHNLHIGFPRTTWI